MTVEDTQNDDELDLPTVSGRRRGANGENPAGRDLGVGVGISRLLTPDLALLVDGGWRRLDTGRARQSGWMHGKDRVKLQIPTVKLR